MQYIKDVLSEFKKINWLSLRRAVVLTFLVFVATLIAGFYLGAVDSLYAKFIGLLII